MPEALTPGDDAVWHDLLAARDGGRLTAPAIAHPLGRRFAPLFEQTSDGVLLVGQFGQSLDGRIAALSGESCYISGAAGLEHLHRLRALCDAVVVGVGTAIADDPLLTVRRCTGPSPARIVIDPSGRLPDAAKCLGDDGARRIVIQSTDAPARRSVESIGLDVRNGQFDPFHLRRVFVGFGFSRVLIEGGPKTIRSFMTAGALDRLHVLVAPVILGSGIPSFALEGAETLADALRPTATTHMIGGAEVLFDLALRD